MKRWEKTKNIWKHKLQKKIQFWILCWTKSCFWDKMADITVINHYANPSFKPKEEALSFFCKEGVDQYEAFSHQLEQTKVGLFDWLLTIVVWYWKITEGECFRSLYWVYWIFWRNSKDGWLNGTIKEEFE